MSIILRRNLLLSAFNLIDRQTINYYKFNNRILNSVGQWISEYDEPIEIQGSLQPVPRSLYEQYGLDFQKDYYNFFALSDVMDVEREVSGDQLEFLNNRYQVNSKVAWYSIDEWVQLLCIKITNA